MEPQLYQIYYHTYISVSLLYLAVERMERRPTIIKAEYRISVSFIGGIISKTFARGRHMLYR